MYRLPAPRKGCYLCQTLHSFLLTLSDSLYTIQVIFISLLFSDSEVRCADLFRREKRDLLCHEWGHSQIPVSPPWPPACPPPSAEAERAALGFSALASTDLVLKAPEKSLRLARTQKRSSHQSSRYLNQSLRLVPYWELREAENWELKGLFPKRGTWNATGREMTSGGTIIHSDVPFYFNFIS